MISLLKYLFVFDRSSGKNAPQHLCFDGRGSDERWQDGADLECDCPLQTGSRSVAVRERSGRRSV